MKKRRKYSFPARRARQKNETTAIVAFLKAVMGEEAYYASQSVKLNA